MLSFCFIFAVLLSTILLAVFFVTSFVEYSDMGEKMTAFECGFDPLSESRSPFSTRFFLLVVLFLIFDVEVALLFPMLSIVSFSSSTLEMAAALLAFLAILLFGTFHEWNEGALDWVSE
uniref:NADH dehydrogenase subunit 3 n=1 Tax=Philine kinglipini TaxID=3030995 RepID=UPI00255207A1|nr:NADH dehydrogenase subunit 3 [Philine kinglipini]WFG53987.1 NADH dehydrogenase subunit 3 [Philine kinglipini]